MVGRKKANLPVSNEDFQSTKITSPKFDDTINFIERKNTCKILSESSTNILQLPMETPMNSTVRSINSPMSGSTGGTPPRRSKISTDATPKRVDKQLFSKFNAFVTPAQMDPFRNSSFKIAQNPDDTNIHGQFLQINRTLEEDIIKSTVRRRPNVKTIAYNTTYERPTAGGREQIQILSESTIFKQQTLKIISKIIAGILTFTLRRFDAIQIFGEIMSMDYEDSNGAMAHEKLIMEEERVLNTYDSATDYASNSSSFNIFKDVKNYVNNIRIKIINVIPEENTIEFDLINVEAPIANTLRRVLLAEVPTMAIEKVMLYQNTSVIQDEVLCHRLGLLPLKADPRKFDWPGVKIEGINEEGVDMEEEPPVDPKKHLVFDFHVKCVESKVKVQSGSKVSNYENEVVKSNQIIWHPIGNQAEEFGDDPPRMVHDDVIVAKLKGGQEIEAKLHCVKGIGRDHAKFSPVATASYRLLPTITLKEDVYGDAAIKFQQCFSEGVVDVVDSEHGPKAVVVNARNDLCSRNVLRHEEFKDIVELGRIKNHFIFSVESTGALKAEELVIEACKIIQWKAQGLKSLVQMKFKKL
ncbi:DNA-directed RNA polymerases I and III subunit RPAC1 [Strongyloides ratti]|uniref:DNA-directed RNA polymerases I and III subunit RPAC1 n=1 Tax=Strongyloides ratti TaxID=34506 RepID=A0A090L1G4_STRRB|nr:DNA-directed RNA polymerases I and III subunit RPAC1 [Strongyloides ratti]CEF61957.1 DNA-directed RNA polymerases I and III subunit RPAC1 [Strongyloides ratti]